MFDKYAHLRKLYVTFKSAADKERSLARRDLLVEAARLDLTYVGLHAVLYTPAPEAVN